MYWRSYYQCEPGTEFLDSLDQCVFKGDARNCKKEVVCTQRIENCYTKRSCDASIEGKISLNSYYYALLVKILTWDICGIIEGWMVKGF